MGFLGVGTILITGSQKIKGLTTAAGLWAAASLGLAIGIGFYEGAIIVAVTIFVSLSFLEQLEKYIYNHSRRLNIYVEISDFHIYKQLLEKLKELGCEVSETDFNSREALSKVGIGLILYIRMPAGAEGEKIASELESMNGVLLIYEM